MAGPARAWKVGFDQDQFALEGELHQFTVENEVDLLVLALHLLMTEDHFSLPTSSESPGDNYQIDLIQRCKCSKSLYRIHYEHRDEPSVTVTMGCVVMHPKVVVHGVCKSMKNTTVTLDISLYCERSKASRLKNCRSLRVLFKDEFVDRLHFSVLHATKPEASAPPLLTLPPELQISILLRCNSVKTVINLSKTCRSLNLLIKDNNVWRVLYHQHFGQSHHSATSEPVVDWLDRYKVAYEKEQNRLRELREHRRMRPLLHIRRPFPLPVFGPYIDPPPDPYTDDRFSYDEFGSNLRLPGRYNDRGRELLSDRRHNRLFSGLGGPII